MGADAAPPPLVPAAAAAAQSDLLHRALAASGDSRCWLLIDPTLRPLDGDEPLAQALSEAGAEIVLVRSPHPRIDDSVMPVLAQLDSARAAGSAALQRSIAEALAECEPEALRHGAARRIGGWLQSSVPGVALAQHIGRQMVHQRQDGRTTLLRWIDPAVLWVIGTYAVLSKPQRDALLGPISAYYLLDPSGRAVRLGPSGDASADAGGRAFTELQWQQLDAIGPLNQALLRFDAATRAPELLNSARDAGMAAILRARSLGFADAQDLAAFAWRAMSVHPRFEAHPLIAEQLQNRQPGDLFTALVDALDASAWLRIAAEAWEPRPR